MPPPDCDCPPLPPGPADLPAPGAPVPGSDPKIRSEIIKMRREKRGGGREVIILEAFPKGGFSKVEDVLDRPPDKSERQEEEEEAETNRSESGCRYGERV